METAADLREGFLSFFESNGHGRHAPSSLVPPPGSTTLFTIAGMQQFWDFFLGAKQPPGPRLTTVQKTMRAGGKHNDLDDVGSTERHGSFFEMLGNFSFGDYFKDGAIDLAWEFVLERLGFPEERLWATVFAGDPELGLDFDEAAVHGWLRVGMPRDRIVALPRADNFWQAADVGPCGPNSEMYFDRGEELGCGRPDCKPGCECERFLEFWNLVFMEFDLADDGTVTPLPTQNVDTGMGLERTAMLMQGVDSMFETDHIGGLMAWVEERSGKRYGESELVTKACRVIADHARASTFLIADGVVPSNEGRGYVLRRVIRRAVHFGRRIGVDSPFMWEISGLVRDQMSPWYPELVESREQIERYLRAEEERFSETLARGEKLFDEVARGKGISGADAFKLHDTYGFPLELTRELALERGLTVDEDEFTRLMDEQRTRSRTAGGEGDRAAAFSRESGFRTEFVGYETTEVLTQIGALEDVGDGTFLAKLRESPFYASGGGQVTDAGSIELDDGSGTRAELREAHRLDDDQVLVFEGAGFAAGDRVRAVVPWVIRFPTMANHTATHLLHKALQEVLGDHVRQAGSAVRPENLRFDFTHPQALTAAERDEIERRVNERVFQNLAVRTFETPIDEARRLGAMMLFGEKYGDVVRVVEIEGYSRELCGGTHVRRTAEIGPFAILSERSVGAGARRIEAVTSGEAYSLLHARSREADELRTELERVRKEAKKPRAEAAAEFTIVDRDGNVVLVETKAVKGGDLRDLSDRVRQQEKAHGVIVGSVDDGRAYLVVNLDESLVGRGLDASQLVRELGRHIGGGGGGRPTLGEAGGRNPDGLRDALEAGKQAIAAALA